MEIKIAFPLLSLLLLSGMVCRGSASPASRFRILRDVLPSGSSPEIEREFRLALASLPDGIADLYPTRLTEEALEAFPPEVLMRLPPLKDMLTSGRISPSFFARYLEKNLNDALLHWTLDLFRNQVDGDKVHFLDELGRFADGDVWGQVGRHLSSPGGRWWTSWNGTAEALFYGLCQGEGRLRLLLELDPLFYAPRLLQGGALSSPFCLEEMLDLEVGVMLPWLADRLLNSHWGKLDVTSRRQRFRFWNQMLLRAGAGEGVPDLEVRFDLAAATAAELYPAQLEEIFDRARDGEERSRMFTYKEFPLLWPLRSCLIPKAKSGSVFLRLLNKGGMSVKEALRRRSPLEAEILAEATEEYLLSGKGDRFAARLEDGDDSGLSKAFMMETLCAKSVQRMGEVDAGVLRRHLFVEREDEERVRCLSEEQERAAVDAAIRGRRDNKLEGLPLDLFSRVFSDMFDENYQVGGGLGGLIDADLNRHQSRRIAQFFLQGEISSDILLDLHSSEDIFSVLSPSLLFNATPQHLAQLPAERLREVPVGLASHLLALSMEEEEGDGDVSYWNPLSGAVSRNLLLGLSSDQVGRVALIAVDQVASAYLARLRSRKMGRSLFLDGAEADTLRSLGERLSLSLELQGRAHEVEKRNKTASRLLEIALKQFSSLEEKKGCQAFSPSSFYDDDHSLLLEAARATRYPGLLGWWGRNPLLEKDITSEQLLQLVGDHVQWTEQTLVQLGPLVLLLSLDSDLDLLGDDRQLENGLRAALAENQEILEEVFGSRRACFDGETRRSAASVVGRLAGAIKVSEQLTQEEMEALIHEEEGRNSVDISYRIKREVAMHEKPICDLNSLNLTHSIFDFVLGVVERKLLRQQQQQVAATTSSGSAQRNGGRYYQLPQLGPLIMDVAVQRQTVIRKALSEDPLTPPKTAREIPLLMEDEEEFLRNVNCTEESVKALTRILVDIYLHAVKRLVISANVRPEDLYELDCRVAELDLYRIFPLPAVGELYKRIKLSNGSADVLRDAIVHGEPTRRKHSPLFSVFAYGSSSSFARNISDEILHLGNRFMKDLHTEVLRVYNRTLHSLSSPSSSSSSSTSATGLSSRVEYALASERLEYFDRLRRVFAVPAPVEDRRVPAFVEAHHGGEEGGRLFLMEKLCFQFKVIETFVSILGIRFGDVADSFFERMPDDVICELFPDYGARRDDSDLSRPTGATETTEESGMSSMDDGNGHSSGRSVVTLSPTTTPPPSTDFDVVQETIAQGLRVSTTEEVTLPSDSLSSTSPHFQTESTLGRGEIVAASYPATLGGSTDTSREGVGEDQIIVNESEGISEASSEEDNTGLKHKFRVQQDPDIEENDFPSDDDLLDVDLLGTSRGDDEISEKHSGARQLHRGRKEKDNNSEETTEDKTGERHHVRQSREESQKDESGEKKSKHNGEKKSKHKTRQDQDDGDAGTSQKERKEAESSETSEGRMGQVQDHGLQSLKTNKDKETVNKTIKNYSRKMSKEESNEEPIESETEQNLDHVQPQQESGNASKDGTEQPEGHAHKDASSKESSEDATRHDLHHARQESRQSPEHLHQEEISNGESREDASGRDQDRISQPQHKSKDELSDKISEDEAKQNLDYVHSTRQESIAAESDESGQFPHRLNQEEVFSGESREDATGLDQDHIFQRQQQNKEESNEESVDENSQERDLTRKSQKETKEAPSKHTNEAKKERKQEESSESIENETREDQDVLQFQKKIKDKEASKKDSKHQSRKMSKEESSEDIVEDKPEQNLDKVQTQPESGESGDASQNDKLETTVTEKRTPGTAATDMTAKRKTTHLRRPEKIESTTRRPAIQQTTSTTTSTTIETMTAGTIAETTILISENTATPTTTTTPTTLPTETTTSQDNEEAPTELDCDLSGNGRAGERELCASLLFSNLMRVLSHKGLRSQFNRTFIAALERIHRESLQHYPGPEGLDGALKKLNRPKPSEGNLTTRQLSIARDIINHLKLKPKDLGFVHSKHSADRGVRRVFDWFFVKMNAEQRKILIQVDFLFKQTKMIMKKMKKTHQQLRKIGQLRRRMNHDSIVVARKYLRVSDPTQDVRSILRHKLKNGKLSSEIVDEVNEFAFLQKIHIIKEIVKILGLTKQDFDTSLLDRIPLEYIGLIFMPVTDEWTLATHRAGTSTKAPIENRDILGRSSGVSLRMTSPSTRSRLESDKPALGKRAGETLSTPDNRMLSQKTQTRVIGRYTTQDSIHTKGASAELGGDKLSLDAMLSLSFFLYHRVIALASLRKREGKIDSEKAEELETILEGQQSSLMQRLRERLGDEMPASNNDDKVLGFLYVVPGALRSDREGVDVMSEEVVKLQLRTVKQIILTLDLTTQDFNVNGALPRLLPAGFYKYLFGSAPDLSESGDDPDYLRLVDLFYIRTRLFLKRKASLKMLSPRQTILAKQIIHDLNRDSVFKIVPILGLQSSMGHPLELVAKIKGKLTNPKTDLTKIRRIKEIVYFHKIKAIRQLVLLLDIKKEDIDLSTEVPDDLKEHLFNSGSVETLSQRKDQSTTPLQGWEDPAHDGESIIGVFCMSCFHRLYLRWKRDHNISEVTHQAREEERARRERGGLRDGIVRTIGKNWNVWKSLEYLEEGTDFLFDSDESRGAIATSASSRGTTTTTFVTLAPPSTTTSRLVEVRDPFATAEPLCSHEDHDQVGLDVAGQGMKKYSGLISALLRECARFVDTATGLSEERREKARELLRHHDQLLKRALLQDGGGDDSEEDCLLLSGLSTLRGLARILSLLRRDFAQSVHIPSALAEVIFDSAMGIIHPTPGQNNTLEKLYVFVRRELTKRVLFGGVSQQDADRADSAIVRMETTLDELKQKYTFPLPPKDLSEMSFFEKLKVTRIIARILRLKLENVPDFESLERRVLREVFDRPKGEEIVAREVLQEEKEKQNEESTGDDRHHRRHHGTTHGHHGQHETKEPGHEEVAKEGIRDEDGNVPVGRGEDGERAHGRQPSLDFRGPDDGIITEWFQPKSTSEEGSLKPLLDVPVNSGPEGGGDRYETPEKGVYIADFIVDKVPDDEVGDRRLGKRSASKVLRELGRRLRPTCGELRTTGLGTIPLADALSRELGTDEVLDCLDLVADGDSLLWTELWTSSGELGLSRHERLLVLQNRPDLAYSHPEHSGSVADLVWMAENFVGREETPPRCPMNETFSRLEAHLLREQHDNDPSSSSAESLLSLALGLPCFTFRARIKRLASSSPSSSLPPSSLVLLAETIATAVLGRDAVASSNAEGIDTLIENLSFVWEEASSREDDTEGPNKPLRTLCRQLKTLGLSSPPSSSPSPWRRRRRRRKEIFRMIVQCSEMKKDWQFKDKRPGQP